MEQLQIVQTQLTASVKMQLDSASSALRTLESSQDKLHVIKLELSDTVNLSKKSADLFSDPIVQAGLPSKRYHNQYALIKAVSTAHGNFQQALRVYEQLASLERDADRVLMLLRSDYSGNMLLIAAMCFRLNSFKHSILSSVGESAGQAVVFTLKRYFKKVDDAVNEFETKFWEEPAKLFQLLLEKDYVSIVRMAKIMSKMPPEARAKMTSIFDDIVQTKFAGLRGLLDKSLEESLKHLEFYLSDLVMIRDGLSNRFPREMNIVNFFLLSYHRNISQIIQLLLKKRTADNKALSSGDTLELLAWTSDYHRAIEEHFGISREDLEPQVLDPKLENELMGAFVEESGTKVAEWMGTLVKNDCRAFASRSQPPELDADDRFYSVAVIDLCRIVKQTVETAAGASQGALLSRVLSETMRSVNDVYIKAQSQCIKNEYTKFRDPQITHPPYLEEHIIAFANGSTRFLAFSAEFQDQISGDIEDETFSKGIAKHFKLANDGFLQLAKECCDILVDCILGTLRPALNQLFTADWLNKKGGCMRTIEATVTDYLQDWNVRCDPFLLNRIVADLLDRILAAYFEYMRSKTIKPSFLENAIIDLDIIRALFVKHREAEKVNKSVDVAVKLIKCIFASSPRILLLDALAMYKAHPELVQTGLLEQLVLKRSDIEREEYTSTLSGLKKRYREELDAGTGNGSQTSASSFLRFIRQQQQAKK